MKRGLLAAALFAGAAALYLWRVGGPLFNSDDAIYAEMAREMARGGDWLTLHWQGEPVLNRPPLAVWPLAAAVRAFGAAENVLRGTVGLEAAAAVALLFLLAARRHGLAVGVCAALFLAFADRFYVYARTLESEPLLNVCVLAALLCHEKARERPGWLYGWGAFLGLALMTKQMVGGLPLIAPAVAWLEGRRPPFRRLAAALGVTVLVAAPWHVHQWLRFGGDFWDAFFWRNVVGRSVHALHHPTTPLFYADMLWAKEGPLILVAALGLVYCALRRDLLPALWTLAVLVPFSLVASRFDYYALLAYPALALAVGRLLVDAVPHVRWLVAPAVLAAAFWLHLGERVGKRPWGHFEMRELGRALEEHSRPDDVLLVVDSFPWSARFYSQRRTIEVHLDRAVYEEAAFNLPGEIVYAPDVGALAARHPRWFAIARKRDFLRLSSLGTVHLVGETPGYLLFTNLSQPDSP